MKQRYFSEN